MAGKTTARKTLNFWLKRPKLNKGESLFVYHDADTFSVHVHLPDGSYREDQIKSLKERMGN